jgi:hypothetical protein
MMFRDITIVYYGKNKKSYNRYFLSLESRQAFEEEEEEEKEEEEDDIVKKSINTVWAKFGILFIKHHTFQRVY